MEYRTGNVFKLYDSLCIVTRVNKDTTDWVSFDYENMSGSYSNKTYMRNEMCWNCETNSSDYADYDCETCKGSGEYKKEILGMDVAKMLAPNVKKYIISKLLGNFDFNVYLSM
jgi:hypothetical protein